MSSLTTFLINMWPYDILYTALYSILKNSRENGNVSY